MDRLHAVSLSPSKIALLVKVLASLLAFIALMASGIPGAIKYALLVLLFSSVWCLVRRRQVLTVQALGYEQEQWWSRIHGDRVAIEFCDGQLVLPWLMVLHFYSKASPGQKGKRKYHLALCPDSANPDDLRRLRVFLRTRQ